MSSDKTPIYFLMCSRAVVFVCVRACLRHSMFPHFLSSDLSDQSSLQTGPGRNRGGQAGQEAGEEQEGQRGE